MRMTHLTAYECDGKPVSADAFYAIACDPRRSVAVEACAGAGKTWMLVSRIVRALLDGTADGNGATAKPHEILAITFTKKAAGEMRERLDEWLKKFDGADNETLCRELEARGVAPRIGGPAEGEIRKLSNLYRSILASGRSVQIRTFHSWFAALLRTAPVAVLHRLRLPTQYELLEDDAPARALVWRRFYAVVASDTSLKADFEAVVLAYGRFQADKALQGALDKRTEFALADAQGVVDESVKPFGLQFEEFAGMNTPEACLAADFADQSHHQLLQEAARALGRAAAPTFSAKGSELERALSAKDTRGIFSALLTDKGTPRKFGEKIVGIDTIRQAQDLVLRVLEACHQHTAWTYQQRLARLSRALIAEYGALKRERGWVDMNDVESAALVMLGDPVLSGWVQERLDAQIKHLMIDEFQDTNPLQWHALKAWLTSYAGAGTAPSVFLVGDPKQSIYRFRRAEPQVFRAAQDFVVNALGGNLLCCDHTRRNANAVIDTVNSAMAAARDADGYEDFREHTTASSLIGEVGRLPPIPRVRNEDASASPAEWRDSLTTPRELPEETLRTLEARQAAAWISQQIAGGLQPKDIMVLSRKRAGLQPLQDELRALHIPAQIGEKTELIDCCEVMDVVALLDVLVSPRHDLSLARALRSPLFGVEDASLIDLALLQRQHRRRWFDLLQEVDSASSLAGVGATLLRWKSWLDSLPPHDALQAIYDDGDVLARFGAAAPATQRSAVLANLRALLEVALARDGGRYATPYGFVRALKAGGTQAPAAVSADAVRLLTIHGAKGLEAQAVLLLDTDTVERNADSMGVLVDWPGEAAAPQKFIFLVSESRPPACAVATLASEQAARKREELNALYVALTRARHTLVISSIEPHRATTESWWQRLQGLVCELPAPDAHKAATAVKPSVADGASFQLMVLPTLPETLAQLAPVALVEDEDSISARIGKAMHRLLEWGGALLAPQLAAVAREFRLNPAQVLQASELARQIFSGQGAWAWRDEAIAWQGNEIDLVCAGQTLRLDRLVQRKDTGHEGEWWVLDYKSAIAPERQPALLAQLQAYRAAVQRIYPATTVIAAFLTGQGTVVEVP